MFVFRVWHLLFDLILPLINIRATSNAMVVVVMSHRIIRMISRTWYVLRWSLVYSCCSSYFYYSYSHCCHSSYYCWWCYDCTSYGYCYCACSYSTSYLNYDYTPYYIIITMSTAAVCLCVFLLICNVPLLVVIIRMNVVSVFPVFSMLALSFVLWLMVGVFVIVVLVLLFSIVFSHWYYMIIYCLSSSYYYDHSPYGSSDCCYCTASLLFLLLWLLACAAALASFASPSVSALCVLPLLVIRINTQIVSLNLVTLNITAIAMVALVLLHVHKLMFLRAAIVVMNMTRCCYYDGSPYCDGRCLLLVY